MSSLPIWIATGRGNCEIGKLTTTGFILDRRALTEFLLATYPEFCAKGKCLCGQSLHNRNVDLLVRIGHCFYGWRGRP